jgi:PST family polysaccharide transporter
LAAEALRYLALLGVIRIITELTYDFLVAVGRSGSNLIIQAAWVVALGPTLTLGARFHGVKGIGLGHLAVGTLVAVPFSLAALRLAGVRIRPLIKALFRPVVGGAVCAATAWIILTIGRDTPIITILAAGMATAVYLLVVAPIRHTIPRTS